MDELKSTVLSESPRIDVLGFTETFLTSLTDDNNLNVEGYSLYRRDRKFQRGGGIKVYVSDKWDTYRRNDLEDENTETVGLEVRFPKARSILVCYVYHPPDSLLSWFSIFSKQLELAAKNRHETILLGDFNLDLTSHSYSNEHNVLQDIIQLNSYTQIKDVTIMPSH